MLQSRAIAATRAGDAPARDTVDSSQGARVRVQRGAAKMSDRAAGGPWMADARGVICQARLADRPPACACCAGGRTCTHFRAVWCLQCPNQNAAFRPRLLPMPVQAVRTAEAHEPIATFERS